MEPRYVSDLRQEPWLLFRMFTFTNGPKKLAVLTEWPYYQGKLKFHDLRAVITNTPHIAFTVLFTVVNNGNVDIAYSN